jgi:hypothetical protein
VHHRRRFASLAATLALVAVLFRGLIAPGYMVAPDAADPSRLVVTLCSVHGPQQVVLDLETGAVTNPQDEPSQPSGKSTQDAPCVFAAAGALTTPSDPVAIAAPALHPSGPALAFPRTVRIGQGLAAPPPPATGPPLSI